MNLLQNWLNTCAVLGYLGLDYRDVSESDESDNFNIQKFVAKKVKNQH